MPIKTLPGAEGAVISSAGAIGVVGILVTASTSLLFGLYDRGVPLEAGEIFPDLDVGFACPPGQSSTPTQVGQLEVPGRAANPNRPL